jgi:hypothetical protein
MPFLGQTFQAARKTSKAKESEAVIGAIFRCL